MAAEIPQWQDDERTMILVLIHVPNKGGLALPSHSLYATETIFNSK